MGKGGSAPQSSDPAEIAQLATQSNKDIADFQSKLNNVNQNTPYGTLDYSQGEDGTWTATQAYTPEVKALMDQGIAGQQQLGDLKQTQLTSVSDALTQPLGIEGSFEAPDYDTNAIESRLMELGRSRLDPALQDRRTSLQNELVSRGIRPGSTAYDAAMRQANEGENDAYNELVLKGRGQAMSEFDQAFNQSLNTRNQNISEALLRRQTPLNEYLALNGQTQMPQPNFVNPAQTGVAGTDVAGIYQNDYTNRTNAYNLQQQQQQQTLGGLFGLGANALMAFSDRRLKTDVNAIGRADNGLTIYSYRMKTGGPVQIGFMADEVKAVNPTAVMRGANGFDMVDYGKAVA